MWLGWLRRFALGFALLLVYGLEWFGLDLILLLLGLWCRVWVLGLLVGWLFVCVSYLFCWI